MKFLIRIGIFVFAYIFLFGFATAGIDMFGDLSTANLTVVKITALVCSIIIAAVFKITINGKD